MWQVDKFAHVSHAPCPHWKILFIILSKQIEQQYFSSISANLFSRYRNLSDVWMDPSPLPPLLLLPPTPPLRLLFGLFSTTPWPVIFLAIGCWQLRHFFIRMQHSSQTSWCPHGSKKIKSVISEHNRHSPVFAWKGFVPSKAERRDGEETPGEGPCWSSRRTDLLLSEKQNS